MTTPSAPQWPLGRVALAALVAAAISYCIGRGFFAHGGNHPEDLHATSGAATGDATPHGESATDPSQRKIEDAALPALLEKVLAAPGNDRQLHDLYDIAERLSAAQFPTVIAYLCKKKDRQLAGELLGYWFEKDFASARAYVASEPMKELDDWLLWEAGGTWARINPQDYSRWITSLSSKDQVVLGQDGIYNLALQLVPFDPQAAVRIYTEGPGARLPDGVREVLCQWAKRDPSAAAAKALSLPPSLIKDQAIEGIVEEWTKRDPESARTFVDGIGDSQLRDRAVIALCGALKDTNPEGAADALAQFNTASFSVRDAFNKVLSGWVTKDAQAALDWASDLPDSPAQSYALGTIIASMAAKDPDQAARVYADSLAAGLSPNAEAGASKVAISLAKKEGIGAASAFLEALPPGDQEKGFHESEWSIIHAMGTSIAAEQALQLPSGPQRDQWLQSVAVSIAQDGDLKGASKLLDRIASPAERNDLAAQMAEKMIWANPEGAVTMFTSISDGHQHLLDATEKWLTSENRLAAEKWVRSTNAISEGEKNALLGKLPPNSTTTAAPTSGS